MVTEMKVGWIETIKHATGGRAYDSNVQRVIAKKHDLEIFNVGFDKSTPFKYPILLYKIARLSGKKDVWVKRYDSIIMLPFERTVGKNIAIIYHIDITTAPYQERIPLFLLEKIFYRNLWKVDAIVTICKFYYNRFVRIGYPNVKLIYPAYNVNDFKFTEKEIEDFKKRYGIDKKPIIYIGNCQRIKGVVESYKALKDMNVHLITSGRKTVDIPAINLNLPYRDYLRLLKASSVVVTMSKFIEGWLLTAHEAMLCKTPVVGSQGLYEILQDGDQIICEDFNNIRSDVEYAMDHPELGERGYNYAKQFTIERFENEWIKFMKEFE